MGSRVTAELNGEEKERRLSSCFTWGGLTHSLCLRLLSWAGCSLDPASRTQPEVTSWGICSCSSLQDSTFQLQKAVCPCSCFQPPRPTAPETCGSRLPYRLPASETCSNGDLQTCTARDSSRLAPQSPHRAALPATSFWHPTKGLRTFAFPFKLLLPSDNKAFLVFP